MSDIKVYKVPQYMSKKVNVICVDGVPVWTEITKGLYRYVVAASCCYEIHIMYHAKDTDILTANASLYIVGDWRSPENN